jgi:hypothetical protein
MVASGLSPGQPAVPRLVRRLSSGSLSGLPRRARFGDCASLYLDGRGLFSMLSPLERRPVPRGDGDDGRDGVGDAERRVQRRRTFQINTLADARSHIDGQRKRRSGVGAAIRRSIPVRTSPTGEIRRQASSKSTWSNTAAARRPAVITFTP